MLRLLLRALAAAALSVSMGSLPAAAHVSFETSQAPADTFQKLVLRVLHGCGGSPTVKLRVQIPEGVSSVKQQPKGGWKSAPVSGKLRVPVDDGHGRQITEGVREAVWMGGRLGDEEFDEFVLHVKLPDRPGTTLYFPVVQECAKGVTRWIETPEAGKSAQGLREPAPALRLLPKP